MKLKVQNTLFKEKSWFILPNDTVLNYSCLCETIALFLKNWCLFKAREGKETLMQTYLGGVHGTACDSSVMRIEFEETCFFCLKWKSAEGEIKNGSAVYFSI